jgi:hypothetical protein
MTVNGGTDIVAVTAAGMAVTGPSTLTASSGVALTVTGPFGSNITNWASTGGTTAGAAHVGFDTNGNTFFTTDTASTSLTLGSFSATTTCNITTAGSQRINVAASGAVVINAPTAAVAFTVTGVSGSDITDFGANYNGIANVGIANSSTGASSEARLSFNTGTANSSMLLRQIDSAGSPSSQIYMAAAVNFFSILMNNGTAAFQITKNGDVSFNPTVTALATSATHGFTYLPICAGIPTGVPATTWAGSIPFVYDSTDGSLNAYFTPSAGTAGWMSACGVMPQNSQAGNYTFKISDIGGSTDSANTGAATFTIPANATTAFPIGAVLHGGNFGTTALSIAITTDTLTLAGTSTTGTRTVGVNGAYTLRKYAATKWFITGPGVS